MREVNGCGARNSCFYFIVVVFTRPIKAVNLTKSFIRSVYVVCTLIADSKDNSGLFHSYDAGENLCLNAS